MLHAMTTKPWPLRELVLKGAQSFETVITLTT
jgi:hypothetical protein